MKINKRSGLSLIVLVITIIVMIILAAVIILSLNSNGIIGKANKAKVVTDVANAKNLVSVCDAEWELMSETEKNGETFSKYATNKLKEAGYNVTKGEEGAYLITEEREIYRYPKIPKGFTISPYDGEQELEEGLVIYELTDGEIQIPSSEIKETSQTIRDQYVWVPVPEMSEFVRRDGYKGGALQIMVSNGEVTEPFSKDILSTTNDLTGEYAEYAAMKASVEKYGGFYIARYEAGDETATSVRTAATNEVEDKRMVVSKKNSYVYNYVPWGKSMKDTGLFTTTTGIENVLGAVELSRSIYPENEGYEVVSHLIYGVQWDAVINFMNDVKNISGTKSEYYIGDSINMGWYGNNQAKNVDHKTGVDVNVDTDKNGENDLIATNKIKNIYDMAGNVMEWTMEAHKTNGRVLRGGGYSYGGSDSPTSGRTTGGPNGVSGLYGFRVALYLV